MFRDRFLMCPPEYYGVEYVINPWMQGNIGRSDPALARTQWQALRDTLERLADIETLAPVEHLPDMPFVANAGLIWRDIFVPARFRFAERQPEAPHYVEWARQRGYRVVELPGQGAFEGEGDALIQPGTDRAWFGYGVRSSLNVARHLAERLDLDVVPLRLIDERFYHLDTCFCPLDDGRILYYPDAFDRDSQQTIAAIVPESRRLVVGATDALRFACNAVVSARTFIANFASAALRERLAAWGYSVVVCPLSQFLLAGGAAKCLVLHLVHPPPAPAAAAAVRAGTSDRVVELRGHLLDSGLMNRALDSVAAAGASFEIEAFAPGLGHEEDSTARLRVIAPTPVQLAVALDHLLQLGARIAEAEVDAHLQPVTEAGVAPEDFYSTTIYGTDVRVGGRWIRARGQRMDAVLVVEEDGEPAVHCRLMRDLTPGDKVVCGVDGIRIHRTPPLSADGFAFMSASVSSERRVEIAVERIAWEIQRIGARGGRIVVVAGPVVVHTGGATYLERLIRRGYVHALLAGNGFAVHDIEHALFGTSLGVDLRRGAVVRGGHRHHLRAINTIRRCGSIVAAVEQGVLRSGVMHALTVCGVPYALAGSIRDDGPLPETMMDLLQAQAEYARQIAGADMILMLSSMLHAIGVGNMTPAGVRLVCVDINPAVVTKLADRGSVESTGIVTDVGLFLNRLDAQLERAEHVAEASAPQPRPELGRTGNG